MIVYLWDAGRWCGVSGTLAAAKQAAAEHMGDCAWIDEARAVYDTMRSLVRTYERTGRTWTAQQGSHGVWWAASWTPAGAAL